MDKHREYFCNIKTLVISSFKMSFQEIVAHALNGERDIVIKSMMEGGLLNSGPLCNCEHEEQRINLQEDMQRWHVLCYFFD